MTQYHTIVSPASLIGHGVPYRDLLILNLKAELGAMQDQSATPQDPAGCSTVVINDGRRIILAHNEDGHKAYTGRMFVLRMRPTDKPAIFCVTYPGILPGNAPWANDQGVVMTTNFIYSKEVNSGVGRYFLDRTAMEARTLDQTLAICTHPERAYAFHHVILSTREGRAVSLEVTPSQQSKQQISGLMIHTNHLIHPSMKNEPQDTAYISSSSMTRWKVLESWRGSQPAPEKISAKAVIQALAQHQGKPYSPCRHPQGKVDGTTLLTALFKLPEESLRIYRDQPCLGKTFDYPGSFGLKKSL